MRPYALKISACCSFFVLCVCLLACQKPKEAKVIVTKQEFAVNQVSGIGYEATAKGEVQNTGEVDLKNIVVTAHCLSCPENMIMDTWFVSNIKKAADEQAVINYLPVGAKAEFSFVGVAMFMTKNKQPPQTLPDKLQVEIVSFEPAS